MTFHQTINLETAKNILADRYIVDTSEHDEQVRSDERWKFAEWLVEHVGLDCTDCVRCGRCKTGTCLDNLLDEYEKKQKGGAT